VAAVGGLELAFELKLLQGAFAVGCHKDDIAALAAVTTIRSAPGYEFFTAEAQTSASAVPGLNGNGCFINEFHSL